MSIDTNYALIFFLIFQNLNSIYRSIDTNYALILIF